MRKFADNWNKFIADEINSKEFAEQQYSPVVEIYKNTGRCESDGKFFGIKQARRLAERWRENLNLYPLLDLETAKLCPDQKTCHFWNTHQTTAGSRVITKILIDETEDKIARITINREASELMASKFIDFHDKKIDAHTFVEEFFSKDVKMDVQDELNGISRILTFEELPDHLNTLENPESTIQFTSRRPCHDCGYEYDIEMTYEIGKESVIFWGSLTPAQDRVQRGVIRRHKWLFGQ